MTKIFAILSVFYRETMLDARRYWKYQLIGGLINPNYITKSSDFSLLRRIGQDTHVIVVIRFQYRALRISMGLIMGSTANNSLGILSGIPQLRHRLFYLYFRYLAITFHINGHPLRDKLEKLNDLSPQ
jgi:hypothetical protein